MHSFFAKLRRKGLAVILLFLFFSGGLLLFSPKTASAQLITADTQTAQQTILQKVWDFVKKAYEKGGAAAFQQATRTALNKIAYDTATYLGSGGKGQQPLFVTKDWGSYLSEIGDQAAGQFIESAVNNWNKSAQQQKAKDARDAKVFQLQQSCAEKNGECIKNCGVVTDPNYSSCTDNCDKDLNTCISDIAKQVSPLPAGTSTTNSSSNSTYNNSYNNSSYSYVNVCQPSSIEAKLQISLGLVDYNRPQAPNCSASQLVQNWDDAAKRLTNFNDPNFLGNFSSIFNPVSNDLGIYMTLRTDMTNDMSKEVDTSKTKLTTNGGWLDVRNIAGDLTGTPNEAKAQKEMDEQGYVTNLSNFAGDALVGAANTFLNQLAITAFRNAMRKLGQTASQNTSSASLSNASSDPNIKYGEGSVKESVAQLIQPNFSVRADYNILSNLTICRDRNNPGPTDCVIDNKMMQAITEKKTVAEAIDEGYLHKDWLFSTDYREGNYNLRNLEILRQYRILPVSWELAAESGKQASLMDLVSCYSPDDSYNQYSSAFNIHDQSWCRGLVDPNWVLKAPLNYCAKEGYGGQILSTMVVPETSLNSTSIKDTIQVTRADNYCADNQTCIKEKADGSCEAYGYCQSERRTWDFNSQSCEPIDNTCQTFINSTSGQKVSYLQNTLDYKNCNADDAGCKLYSLFGVYDANSGSVSWSSQQGNDIYFNRNLSDCSATSEGCSEMLRVQPGWGSNLVMGAGFGDDNVGDSLDANGLINNYWPVWSDGQKAAEIVNASDIDNASAGKALQLSAGKDSGNVALGLYSNNSHSLLPANLNIISGESYTLSADVYLITGDKVQAVIGDDYGSYTETRDKNAWRHISITRDLSQNPLSEMSFEIVGYGSAGQIKFAVRNLKLEMNGWDSGFSLFGAYKVYEKLIPPYLASSCYVNSDPANPDYRLRSDAPAVCKDFARQCNRDEVGCKLYQEKSTGFSVAAQAVSSDYCDASCNGYNIYVSKATYFNSPFSEKLIPQKGQACSADAVGCNEFTNLDAAASGGESKEYYSQLKQCVKPSNQCAAFYTWQDTGNKGYQLQSVSLKKNLTTGEPAVTADDSSLCNADIYKLSAGDPGFNADCQQFYDKDGKISYHLTSHTITCSDNCHSYRMSEKNTDTTISQDQCQGSDRNWDATASVCDVCLNGGTWSNQYQSCIYQAIPQEGKTCKAADNGCREYNGNSGNNTKLITADSFGDNYYLLQGNCQANGSTVPSDPNQDSLFSYSSGDLPQMSPGTCATGYTNLGLYTSAVVGNAVTKDKAYTLQFTARSDSPNSLKIALVSSNGNISYFGATGGSTNNSIIISGDNQWHAYQVNLPNLDHAVDSNERLVISSYRDVYLDNLVLTEISDRYYLVKGSSQIPNVCYYDMSDTYQGPDYNLGCSAYTDSQGDTSYLRQFSKLCQDSAVGCELMVNTHNYSDYKSGIWNDTNGNGQCDNDEKSCVSVPGDNFFYAIYNNKYLCNGADSGCSRMGESISSGANASFSDVFKLNKPDNYSKALCGADSVGCSAWQNSDGNGESYFKDPGNDACVYRSSKDPAVTGKAWYKVPVMRCDLNNDGQIDGTEKGSQVCSSSADCANNSACLVDSNDYPCAVSYFKTIGLGGAGNQIPVPTNSAGLCSASASGCQEYVDPVSRFADNLVLNPSIESEVGWTNNGAQGYSQSVDLERNKLYIFSVDTASSTLANDLNLNFDSAPYVLGVDNELRLVSSNSFTIPKDNPKKQIIFDSRGNDTAEITGNVPGQTATVKVSLVNYQLKQNLDKRSCNGAVDFNNGCILFNERKVDGGQGLVSLNGGWDATLSQDGQTPALCDSNSSNCDANVLIKVRPDRTCASWLDCLTYVEDPVTKQRTCYAVGECNRLGDNNECVNFVGTGNKIIDKANNNLSMLTGYSLLDRYNIANMKEVGLDTDAHFDFESASPSLNCKTNTGGACQFDTSVNADSLVTSPTNAPTDYPAQGKAYLKVLSGQQISPHSPNAPIEVQSGQDYYLNYLVNTKNSGANAKIFLYLPNHDVPFFTATSSSPNGWSRKVVKIPASILDGIDNFNLYLGSDAASGSERYVYYDDINIEPVLEVADGKYVAKECRLYPSQDSTSCTSKNSRVISDGIFGYCLQHDPANANVCLTWYPTDQISAGSLSGRSTLGYQGASPLDYCTQANGNFTLLEKRVGFKFEDQRGGSGTYCEKTTQPCSSNGQVLDDPNYVMWISHHAGNGGHNYSKKICIPKQDNLMIKTKKVILGSEMEECAGQSYYEGWGLYDGFSTFQGANNCDPGEGCTDMNEAENANPAVRVYDYGHPTVDEDQLKLISSTDPEKVFYPTCNQLTQVVDASGSNKSWANRTNKNSIYPYTTPLFFRYNNTYYGPASNCYTTRQRCVEYGNTTTVKQFTQPTDGGTSGGSVNNGGVGTTCLRYETVKTYVSCDTPGAISEGGTSSGYDFTAYGRNRELIPFGAATIPDNYDMFNSAAIKFRNQYSDRINQVAFAGRPYGCENGSGDGCGHLGYCSLNPNVICVLDTSTSSSTSLINQRSCGSANGTCVPMWKGDNVSSGQTNKSFYPEYILHNIFLKSFGGYQFNNSLGRYVSAQGYDTPSGDYSAGMTSCSVSDAHSSTYDNNYSKYFCAVYPKISNVEVNGNKLNGDVSIPGGGMIAALSFNTKIDADQQPLSYILVDWGDGSLQNLVNIDSQPDASSPHRIYHYYKGDIASARIRIKVVDNWGYFGCNSGGTSGTDCPGK